ncbi:uncharacterized protein LOC120348908 [Nilaparvata lugens]|uniref:uncharacterized protein LOC111050475 n=1 Tax=Nilaparvata lugens TaxID=108931 RepID=UPI00193DEACC|nr:uncharacterized protein LOC111050475 [Nilaparvata lugens]XP_039296141.1 uncharacterized protein LOC120348908 [Nilaparvata lugens]
MTENCDPISLLESRVDALEKKVFGNESVDNFDTSNSVVDLLLKNQTLISTAVSSREKINTFVKRIDFLEQILDPTYEDSLVDRNAKVEVVLMMVNEFQETIERLKMLQDMIDVLESEKIRSVPQVRSRLDRLQTLVVDLAEKTQETNEKIKELAVCYAQIMNSFTKAFCQIDSALKQMEIEANPRKVYD